MKKSHSLLGLLKGLFSKSTQAPTNGTVEYRIWCKPAGFEITYENNKGETMQEKIQGRRWSTHFMGNTGDFVYVSAQAEHRNATIVTKVIYQGKILIQARNKGDYPISTAFGSLIVKGRHDSSTYQPARLDPAY